MNDVLNQSTESRKLSLSLRGVQYGGQLVEELLTFSKNTEKLYGAMQTACRCGDTDHTMQKLLRESKQKAEWFEKAQAQGPTTRASANAACHFFFQHVKWF